MPMHWHKNISGCAIPSGSSPIFSAPYHCDCASEHLRGGSMLRVHLSSGEDSLRALPRLQLGEGCRGKAVQKLEAIAAAHPDAAPVRPAPGYAF